MPGRALCPAVGCESHAPGCAADGRLLVRSDPMIRPRPDMASRLGAALIAYPHTARPLIARPAAKRYPRRRCRGCRRGRRPSCPWPAACTGRSHARRPDLHGHVQPNTYVRPTGNPRVQVHPRQAKTRGDHTASDHAKSVVPYRRIGMPVNLMGICCPRCAEHLFSALGFWIGGWDQHASGAGYSICLLKCETRCRPWPVTECRWVLCYRAVPLDRYARRTGLLGRGPPRVSWRP